MARTIVDPHDGLPLAEVGEWTLEKHARLRKYVDISRATRRKYVGKAGATFIDLYCGPGRAKIRETGEVIDGSPLVAFETAVRGVVPFSEMYLADIDAESCETARARLLARTGAAQTYIGPSDQTVEEVASRLNPLGLHFAFLDPFNLEALPFRVIRRLSEFKRMDLLIHVSAMDLQRNLPQFISGENTALDVFAPGWRDAVDVAQRPEHVRRAILDHWLDLIRKLDMQPSQGIERVTGGKKQLLYWLVFVSRHKLAQKFWDEIRDVSLQRPLL